jgi:hypothetical protein
MHNLYLSHSKNSYSDSLENFLMFKLPKLCWVWKVNVVIIGTCLEHAKGFYQE